MNDDTRCGWMIFIDKAEGYSDDMMIPGKASGYCYYMIIPKKFVGYYDDMMI